MTQADHRVPIAEVTDLIRPGEVLPFRVHDAQDRLLLSAGQLLGSERQVELLIERGAWVERPLVVEHRARLAAAAGVAPPPRAVRQQSLFDRWERMVWDLDAVLRKTTKGRTTGDDLTAFVHALVALVDRDVDVALFVCVRPEEKRFALYPLHHALHTAVLVLVTARHAGWSAERTHSLVGAALTMNVSILELQATMAEQDTPPTQKQLDQIRSHPQRSADLLRAAGVTDTVWLQAVGDHHERKDGGGYPRGIAEVDDDTRLMRMADVYMSKISARAKRPAMAPQAASRQLFQQEPGSPLALALIKAIGVHPPGSLVQLKSGEIAVVKRRASSGPAPVVCTLSDRKGAPTVNSLSIDTHDPEHAIVGTAPEPEKFARVLPERVYGVIEG